MWIELILIAVLVAVYFIVKDRKPANMPPGPGEIPFLGNMPIFDGEKAEKLRQKYGDVVTTRTGSMRSVLIFDYNLGKEVLSRPEMSGRPSFFSSLSLDDQKTGGLVGSNGLQWQHDRRFALKNLRNLGMGKSYLEDAINIEAEALVNDLMKNEGRAIKFPDSFRTASLNIIWQMVASHRYEMGSTDDIDVIYRKTKEFQTLPLYIMLPVFFPVMEKFVPQFIMKGIFKSNLIKEFMEEIKKIMEKAVDEHEHDLDNPRDLIDEYMKEMNEGNETNEFLRRGVLMQIISDLFSAGSDTVNNMLKWVAFLLAKCPEVTKRIQKEIDEFVPRNRLVSLEDKPNLPYVESFVNETLRYSSMIIMNVQHSALKDTTINNYFIPKDSIITVVNYSCHHDPKYWNDPMEFKPERFLDDNGKFKAPKTGFFAFGQGRRQCLGELLARMELFLFTAAIAQNFDILIPDGVEYKMEFDNQLGMRLPFDKTLIYKPRKVE